MTLTLEQLEIRKCGLGSSDIARIIYFDRWQVWAEKTGKSVDKPYTAAMRRGDALEPVIAGLYADRFCPRDITKGDTTIFSDCDWRLATPDYIVTAENGAVHILECKAPAYRRIGWGEEFTDNIPPYVIVQCQWQMGVILGLEDFCHVGALIGNDFLVYEIKRDQELIDKLFEIGEEFWHRYVLTDTPPPLDSSESARVWIERKYPSNDNRMLNRTPETVAMIQDLVDLNMSIQSLSSQKALIENQLKDIIGDTNGITDLCTWKKDKTGKRRFRLL